MNKIINSGGYCKFCGTQSIHYGIDGNYTYECQKCGRNLHKNDVAIKYGDCYFTAKMNDSITWSHDTEKTKEQNEQDNRIHAFYRLKSILLPSFLEKNKRNLGDIEAKLLKEKA